MATHSSILAWRISWAEEPGGLQFMRLQRVGHDLVTECAHACMHTHTHTHTQSLMAMGKRNDSMNKAQG